jgi:hypothetical protein
MDKPMKYEDFTLEDLETIYKYFNGEKGFVCDADKKEIIVEEE